MLSKVLFAIFIICQFLIQLDVCFYVRRRIELFIFFFKILDQFHDFTKNSAENLFCITYSIDCISLAPKDL